MTSAFVVRAAVSKVPIPGVFDELQAGFARIGWSYQDNLDLRLLRDKFEQEKPLDADEREATRRCLGFLTRIEVGDYLLYPHQPATGHFSVVQVTGEYDYSTPEDGLEEDFRSFRPCMLITPDPVGMRDEIVPSHLHFRLGLQGVFYRIHDTSSFVSFLEELPQAGQRQASARASVRRIHNALREKLPEAIHHQFARTDLSRRFCPELFERMGYSSQVQEGPAEAGSDIVLTIDNPLLPCEFRVGVQVFSYEGSVEEWALQGKLDQLLGGWEDNSLDYGVLLTTGHCTEDASAALDDHNAKHPKRLVRLIQGNDLADLFLTYFPPSGHR